MCWVCEDKPAQHERRFHRCCKGCFSAHFSAEEARARAEAARLKKLANGEECNEDELIRLSFAHIKSE